MLAYNKRIQNHTETTVIIIVLLYAVWHLQTYNPLMKLFNWFGRDRIFDDIRVEFIPFKIIIIKITLNWVQFLIKSNFVVIFCTLIFFIATWTFTLLLCLFILCLILFFWFCTFSEYYYWFSPSNSEITSSWWNLWMRILL